MCGEGRYLPVLFRCRTLYDLIHILLLHTSCHPNMDITSIAMSCSVECVCYVLLLELLYVFHLLWLVGELKEFSLYERGCVWECVCGVCALHWVFDKVV